MPRVPAVPMMSCAFMIRRRIATLWLRARVPGIQQVVVAFEEDDCFLCSSVFLVENWSDVFVPSRDDAMIYSNDTPLILFYCHENEFELGQRIVSD